METNRYTECLPTEPGIYWNYTTEYGEGWIIEVMSVRGKLDGRLYGSDEYFARLDSFSPYWAGPICKPEAPEA